MPERGWKQLLAGWPWFHGEGSYPMQPNSEFMPPLQLLRKPYGCWDPVALDEDDPWGWPITEYEEALSLRPGLRDVAHRVLDKLVALARGGPEHGFSEHKLRDNPYWPPELAKKADALGHERFVLLLPLALSLTQDDKARIRWTVFGGSEQGPGRAFWKGFFTAPKTEWPAPQALDFFRQILHRAYGVDADADDLRGAGFRILPGEGEILPSWTAPFLWTEEQPLSGVAYLLTFRPFRTLSLALRRAYLAGRLHLLPFPGSLLFWGIPSYFKLQRQLPFALQIPLLHTLERQGGVHGMRVPQSGWLREPHGTGPASAAHLHGPIRGTYRRSHRHDRVLRSEDELITVREEKLAHVLFSTAPNDVGLYDKPMARNVQLWTHDFDLLLDGPAATPADIHRAAAAMCDGGLFGYRFITPAMRVGRHEVYWHRPLAACLDRDGRICTLLDGPAGYLTAYPANKPDLSRPVELWPRLLRRDLHAANVELFCVPRHDEQPPTLFNVRKVVQSQEMLGRSLPPSFARQLLTLESSKTLDGWLRSLPRKAQDPKHGRQLAEGLRHLVEPAEAADPRPSLTFDRTARRSFEVAYWDDIARLSTGDFVNKNNADCILDTATQAALVHPWRDLDPLGEYLISRHARAIAEHDQAGKALVGELPFCWRTDFAFPWMGGWKDNQEGKKHERNLLVMIPGRDRSRAVLLADHYDTAYMADYYEKAQGGTGARLAAAGADDNCSATAALLQAAPVFLQMSREGRLGCDVWLVHLTGEEYPAEGLGTCHLCQHLVEGTLRLREASGAWHDLSGVRIQGLYVMDMIAHNSNKDRYVFQIAPGASQESLWLALQAHEANRAWNAGVGAWNRKRRGAGRGRRRRHGTAVPAISRHPRMHGEIRPTYDPRSTLYNTDGQNFSDIGVPVVLLMENYDIDRSGYHDSKDTLANINLDYGAALAAIAIEAVARAAIEQPLQRGI